MVTRTTTETRLLRVCTSANFQLANFREGVSLESALGRTVGDLIAQVAADRLDFADQLLIAGDKLLRLRPRMHRTAIGKYYYSMYHAVRAVVFFVDEGDDSQAHSELPKGLPKDFPNYRDVTNDLRDARRERNNADYDPYPSSDLQFRTVALHLQQTTRPVLAEARNYLKGKGCNYV